MSCVYTDLKLEKYNTINYKIESNFNLYVNFIER